MPNIFISHSSADKPFVRKLATALLSEGFPIWFDSWRLELGDSLLDSIYDGIESSSLVLLIISKSANESGWVNRELNAALTKEQGVGRKFLIPIKIDDTDMPLKVADRLYSDFSSSFNLPLYKLSDILEKCGARNVVPPMERELIPLRFSKEVHLDQASLSKAIAAIRGRHGNVTISQNNVVVSDDIEFENLLTTLYRRIDEVESDEFFSAELERLLRHTLDSIREADQHLRQGIAMMISNGCSLDALYWYARLLRGQAVYAAWSAQNPKALTSSDYGRAWSSTSLLSNSAAAEFFEVASVEPTSVWTGSVYHASPFSVWVGSEEIKRIRNEDGVYEGPDQFLEVGRYSDFDKFVLPQMVLQNLRRGTSPIIWNADEAIIGIR